MTFETIILEEPQAIADISALFPAQQRKASIRNAITENAGDTDSLLGTTSDAAHLLLYSFSSLIAKLHTASSLAEVREAAAPFAELSTAFLEKVNSNAVKLPFQAKGLESVVSEIEQRATAVAEVLQSATEGE